LFIDFQHKDDKKKGMLTAEHMRMLCHQTKSGRPVNEMSQPAGMQVT